VDLGDGSERGEYVSQDYILNVLGRPHRSINLMYCYYPFDKGWPLRAEVAYPRLKPKNGHNWVQPYDNYFPYGQPKHKGGPPQPFEEIRDIRRHGQDVTLTLTMDPLCKDSQLIRIARELRPFGRLRLRINHECDGFWFAFNRRYSRRQVVEFFVRFSLILKREAPNVRILCCWGHWDRKNKTVSYLDELFPLLQHSDVWTVDKYLSLHYSWPSMDCEEGGPGYSTEGVAGSWEDLRQVQRVFSDSMRMDRPVEIGEFNFDGNVAGLDVQAAMAAKFYKRILDEKPRWLAGVTFYQFRDRGRLGLEIEDSNHPDVGRPTPLLETYRKIISVPYFHPRETWKKTRQLRLRWAASDDAAGLGWKVSLQRRPVYFELFLPKSMNLMLKVGSRWFYKKPGVERLDVLSGALSWSGKRLPIVLFAPPASGQQSGAVMTSLTSPPEYRFRGPWKKQAF
jgi:hypothetical protein